MTPRLAIVASHPIQYQAPWFRAIARVVDLEVLFCHRQDAAGQASAGFGVAFDWDVPLLDGYASRWLVNRAAQPGVQHFGGCDTPDIGDVLRDGKFDACLVNGWYLKSYVQAIRASHRLGLPVLMRGDSHLKTPRSLAVRAAKALPYRWFLTRRVSAHLYVGQGNRAYLRSYGVPESRLFFAPHFVENDRFAAAADAARRDGSARALRQSCGIADDTTTFVFAGKFIEEKRAEDFVDALGRLRAQGARAAGLMIGDGPLRAALEARARDANAPVHFLGFRNQTGMPACYAAADALVLPSASETWGLVVNEAMACGVPSVVSDAVGCADDLVLPGRTGAVFPVGDVDALTSRLLDLTLAPDEARAAMRAACLEQIAHYTCARAVDGLRDALDSVVTGATTGR